MNARLLALSFVAALLSQGALAADVVIIHAGKLLAEPGSAPAAEQSLKG